MDPKDQREHNPSADEPTRVVPAPNPDDDWLNDILSAPELADELGPDEQAITSAGLTHPDDAILEQIILETKAKGFVDSILEAPAQESTPEPEIFHDEEYRDTFGDGGEGLDEVFSPPPPPEEPDEPEDAPEEPPRKRRPSHKPGYGLFGIPHILATLIWLAITIAIGVSLGRMVWVCTADMMAFGKTSQEVQVVIDAADDLSLIASKLKNAGLIQYPTLFKLFVGIKGDEEDLLPGNYTLNTIYDYNALVNAMKPKRAALEEIEVRIPEGYTCAQAFALLEEQGVCTVTELEDYAANGELNEYWFLDGVERGSRYCLEGYLFPDTYKFYRNDKPRHVLEKFLNAFDSRFTDLMRERFETINDYFGNLLRQNGHSQEYIDSHKLTLHNIVTIASIVEKESAQVTESYTVASVFYNRLANPNSYPYLQSDATVYYAIGGYKDEPLTNEDLDVDSPYNTYKSPGLTPGPISNPSQDSLNAVLEPDETGYYFFYFDKAAGVHRFARTYEEHQENIRRYGGSE